MEKYERDEVVQELETMFAIERRLAEKTQTDDDVRAMLALAEKGTPRAEFNIGVMYLYGIAVEQDRIKAFRYFEKIKEHGSGSLRRQVSVILAAEGETFVLRAVEMMQLAADDYDEFAIKFMKRYRKELKKAMRQGRYQA